MISQKACRMTILIFHRSRDQRPINSNTIPSNLILLSTFEELTWNAKNVIKSIRVHLPSNVINVKYVRTVTKYSNQRLDYKSIFKKERTSPAITVNKNSVEFIDSIPINEALRSRILIKKYTNHHIKITKK